MRYASLRRGGPLEVNFPVGGAWRLDYPVGFTRGVGLTRRVGGYFFLNRGWKKSGFLFSHTRLTWEAGWTSRVYFVGKLRRSRRPRGWTRWVRPRPRRGLRVGPPRRGLRVRKPRRGVRRPRPAPRTRKVRVLVARPGVPTWGEVARVWNPTRWVWCRIPTLRVGTLATLMNHLGYRIRGRFERRIRGVALPLLGLTRKLPGVVGAHLRCSGRFTRRPRGETKNFAWGKLHRGDLGVHLEQAFLTVPLRFGAVGVTLTVVYA